jgi:hypothetical protein
MEANVDHPFVSTKNLAMESGSHYYLPWLTRLLSPDLRTGYTTTRGIKMTHRYKALGLALVAVLTISAVVASTASAVEFYSEKEATFLSGDQVTKNVFTTTNGSVKCNVAKFTGTQIGTFVAANKFTIKEVLLVPRYEGCTAFGQSAEVTVPAGCLSQATAPSSATTGLIRATCSSSPVKVNVPSANCALTLATQKTEFNTDYTAGGAGSTRDILITATSSGIEYTVDGPGIFCGSIGLHVDEVNNTYIGTTTEKGFVSPGGAQVGIWIE